MNVDIAEYNATQAPEYRDLCEALARGIDTGLKKAESKVWHRAPVWFIDGNPIVEGKFKAAELRLTDTSQIVAKDLKRWLKKAQSIQWDYKNIVKRRGVLEKMGDWE